MTVFCDTSAFYALLDEDDARHDDAARAWARLRDARAELWTSNYVLVEATALVQNRLGMAAVRRFTDELLLPVGSLWVDEEIHRTASAAHRAAGRRRLSLVDCASFELMRRRGLRQAFTFDAHFTEQGFLPVR